MNDSTSQFEGLPIFQKVPIGAVAELRRTCVQRSFGKNEMIYFRGQSEGRIFLIISGEVQIYQSSGGQKVVMMVLGPGDFFGDLSFVRHVPGFPSENYAQAVQPTVACVTSPERLGQILTRFPILAMALLVAMRNRLHQTESKVRDLAISPAQTRIMNELIRYAARHSKPVEGGYEIEERLTHQQMAEMTGLTRETVTKTLNFLQAQGFVTYTEDRRLRLHREKILSDCLDCLQMPMSRG